MFVAGTVFFIAIFVGMAFLSTVIFLLSRRKRK